MIDLADEDDIILHGWSKSRAPEGGLPHALQKHRSEAEVISISINALHEENQQVNSSLVEHVALLNGDEIHHVPWELLEVSKQRKRKGVLYRIPW